ncbi:MAG: FliM/FliN family flagellar motor switch protein, partial [Planctomycetota bacterium]
IGHPYIFYEDVLPYFSTKVWLSSQKKVQEKKEGFIFKLLSPTQLEVCAKFPKITIKLRDFLNLYPGSYLKFPQLSEKDIIMEVEGTPLFRCKLGKVSNKYAIQLLDIYK